MPFSRLSTSQSIECLEGFLLLLFLFFFKFTIVLIIVKQNQSQIYVELCATIFLIDVRGKYRFYMTKCYTSMTVTHF